jgi:hypothetical protein
VNQLFIPIERIHLETVFERGDRVQYALLEPSGEISPLRVRFDDLRQRLGDRFATELSAETIVDRIASMPDRQLLVLVNLDKTGDERWDARLRVRHEFEATLKPASLAERRRSPRRAPERPTDVKLEIGNGSIDGTLYNVSEHGLGIALLTTDVERAETLSLDEEVEIVAGEGERVRGHIRSQYPAAGGCVLGIELRQRFGSRDRFEA